MHHLSANSSANLEHLKQARVEFEKVCVAQAAKRRTDADLDRLRRVLDEQARAQNDNARFMVLDAEFHRTIAAIGGNPIFTALTKPC